MTRIRLLIIMIVLTAVTATHAQEEMVLEVIPLRHALVKDIVPVLEPLVAPGGTVTGMNDRLIIKTTASNLEEIKGVLASIDRAPRRRRITVRQDVANSLQARQDAVSVTGRAGDVRARVPGGTTGGDGASVQVGDGDNSVRYDVVSTRAQEDSYNSHFVMGL